MLKRRMRYFVMLAVIVGVIAGGSVMIATGSDHDDGVAELKGINLNLTDLYVFREDYQTGNAGDNGNLILIMCCNPRSVARQQYYFSTRSRYEFHIVRAASNTAEPELNTTQDVTFRFEFGTPDTNRRQRITFTAVRSGSAAATSLRTDGVTPINTTRIDFAAAGEPTTVNASDIHTTTLAGSNFTIFAGPREDPFVFDVEQFFKVRAALRGEGLTGAPNNAFRSTALAVDFTGGYNVLAIVLRAPIAFIQNGTGRTTFDVWETISYGQ